MQRPRSVPTLFLSCLSKTLLWNVRMSPVLSPFLPTSSSPADTRITPFQVLTTSPTTLHQSSDLHASQATRASQAVFVAQQNRALGPREACVVPADRERELSNALLVAARVGIWRVGVAWFGRPPALLLEVGLEREGYSRLRYRSWLDVH